jgi:hypothetical protein
MNKSSKDTQGHKHSTEKRSVTSPECIFSYMYLQIKEIKFQYTSREPIFMEPSKEYIFGKHQMFKKI